MSSSSAWTDLSKPSSSRGNLSTETGELHHGFNRRDMTALVVNEHIR